MKMSGSFKNFFITRQKQNLWEYDSTAIFLGEYSLTYDGELVTTPWNEENLQKILSYQRKKINAGITNTRNMISEKSYKKELRELVNLIAKTEENIEYALFETFYSFVMHAHYKELPPFINKFHQLITDLNNYEYLSQIDLDIILTLFKQGLDYSSEDIRKHKKSFFKIEEDELDINERNLLYLGEFIAPKRVPIISSTLQSDFELSQKILPIYFTIPEETKATSFLQSCQTPDLTDDKIIKNATLYGASESVLNLVRRL